MSDPWWRGAALYQIYPLSFDDSDGDGWATCPACCAGWSMSPAWASTACG